MEVELQDIDNRDNRETVALSVLFRCAVEPELTPPPSSVLPPIQLDSCPAETTPSAEQAQCASLMPNTLGPTTFHPSPSDPTAPPSELRTNHIGDLEAMQEKFRQQLFERRRKFAEDLRRYNTQQQDPEAKLKTFPSPSSRST
jgi:hypothetical protein